MNIKNNNYIFTKENMKLKQIPKQVLFLGFVSLFTDIASEMLYPIVPIFLTAVLGASMSVVGIIEGLAEVTAGVLKGYFGYLSDKLRKRSVFVKIGYTLSGIVKPLPGLFPNIFTVVFSRISDRVGKGIRTSPRDALLAGYAGNNTGAVFGFHRAMDTLGAAIGPMFALALLHFYPGNFTLVFLVAFVPSVLAVAFTFTVKDKIVPTSVKEKISYRVIWKSSPKEFKKLITLFTLFSFVNSSDVFLILKSRAISDSNVIAVWGYIFYNLIYAASSYPFGKLSDKFGKKNIFVIGLIIFSIVYSGFAFANQYFYLWILFALYGIYASSTEGVSKAWVSDLIKQEFRGSAIGLLNMLSSFALMLGSVFAGAMWDKYGSEIPFLISSVVSLIIAFIFILDKKTKV